MTPCVIRQLTPADAPYYRAIRLEALATDPDAFGATVESESKRPLAEFAQRVGTSVVLAAMSDAIPVGLIGLKRHDGAKDQHKAFVWGMFVRLDHRRRGIGAGGGGWAGGGGRGVFAATPADVEQLTLTVVSENPAATTLYERFGFKTYGIEPRALKRGARYWDERLILRDLR